MPRFKRNFVVKTVDGKVAGVQRALKDAGIEVTSVIEVYKEEIPDLEAAAAESAESSDAPAAVATNDQPEATQKTTD